MRWTAVELLAKIAGRDTGARIDGASLVDLTPRVQAGTLTWRAPGGKWKVMAFTWTYSKGRRGRPLVDGASRDAVDWYIRTVYQPHYDHFKDDFGKTIVGYFYDEPETYGDWGTEVIPMLEERGVDWKRALVAWKFTLAGEEQSAARYQYQDAFAEAWGRTLYGGISDWCRRHGVISIGHWLEHNWEYLHPKKCGGNVFQMMKYTDAGRRVSKARAFITADNSFELFVNGRSAGTSSTWEAPRTLDVTGFLRAAENVVAVRAANATDAPNPAGLLARFEIELDGGDTMRVDTDATWRTSKLAPEGWAAAAFEDDDADWPAARVVGTFGAAPWGTLSGTGRGRRLTLSPVAADTFVGEFEIPEDLDLARARVYVETSAPSPEDAAAVKVNDRYAGGFIAGPYRLEVTRHVRHGPNRITIEPFAPEKVEVVVYW